jgi:hypothetical protein
LRPSQRVFIDSRPETAYGAFRQADGSWRIVSGEYVPKTDALNGVARGAGVPFDTVTVDRPLRASIVTTQTSLALC